MSAYKIQTLGNYPEENIQHLEHVKSLKSRMNRTDCGRIKKKKEGHCVYNPADLGGGSDRDLRVTAKIQAAKMYKIRRPALRFPSSSKFSQSAKGPPPVLSEGEEHV
jgi:hypothetical protein